jgi:hypothetical protein
MDPTAALAYLNSPFPICYRLIRRGDGNGNMDYVLQGAFLVTVGGKTTHKWRDLETQDDPYIEDHVPFFTPDEGLAS